jgi:hypothetical protein
MQIRPHCARPTNDLPSTRDHSSDAVLENLIRCERREVETNLAPPQSLETPSMPELPPAAPPQPLATGSSPQVASRAAVRFGSTWGPVAAIAAVVVVGA